jgi:DNA-binding NarL/FixJ family response regulator
MSSNTQAIVALGQFDPLVEIGLKHLLGRDRRIRLISLDLQGKSLGQFISAHKPALIILDEACIADLSKIVTIRQAHSNVAVVVLTRDDERMSRARSLLVGIRYVSQQACTTDIASVIRLAVDGQQHPAVAALTAREAEVMEYLVLGKSYQEVAAGLQIGLETVRTHSTRIRKKLGLKKKRELIGLSLPRAKSLL